MNLRRWRAALHVRHLSHPAATIDPMNELDTATLHFADQWWAHGGAREAAIWDTFGETPVRFSQRLNVLLDRPDAHAAMPQVVNRLRRLREARAAVR